MYTPTYMQLWQCYYPIYNLIMTIKFPVSRWHIDAKGFLFKATEETVSQKMGTLSVKKRRQGV